MASRLWIAYDFIAPDECLAMLDTITDRCPDERIIHEIGRPTLLNAALAGVRIVEEFRSRLNGGQILVADFKGFDVPYSAEGQFYYQAGVDLITVMAAAPDEAVVEAVKGAEADGKQVAFDLMSNQDDQTKADRARELTTLGATLVSCHTGWNEQAAGKRPEALLNLVSQALEGTGAKMVAMGGLTPADVPNLKPYAENETLYAVVSGSGITRSDDPAAVVERFLEALDRL